jgi:hypothetical protein
VQHSTAQQSVSAGLMLELPRVVAAVAWKWMVSGASRGDWAVRVKIMRQDSVVC